MVLLKLRITLMSIIHFITKGYVDVCGLCYCLEQCWCPWTGLPLGIMLVSVAHVAPDTMLIFWPVPWQAIFCSWSILPPETMLAEEGGYVDVCRPWYCLVCHVDVSSLWCHLMPCCCPSSGGLLGAMIVSVVNLQLRVLDDVYFLCTTKGHADVHDLCPHHLMPCRCECCHLKLSKCLCAQCCHWEPWLCQWYFSVGGQTDVCSFCNHCEGHVDICVLCSTCRNVVYRSGYYLGPCLCLWPCYS